MKKKYLKTENLRVKADILWNEEKNKGYYELKKIKWINLYFNVKVKYICEMYILTNRE